MNYFPTTIAAGKAFCNRQIELKHIHYNFQNKIPTLLVSPRRYGKTSLVLQSLNSIKVPYAHIDLYKAMSEQDITRFILNGIGQLLGQIENTPQKLMKIAAEFFSELQLKFSLEKYGLSVEFSKKNKSPVELILSSLEKLDAYFFKKKKQGALFLDEFQIVVEVVDNNSIEAAIREAVQKSKAINYVFSGSNRHLIEAMFNNKKRPFFNLCDSLILKRIDQKHYVPYINHAAKEHWGKVLSNSTIEIIFEITELHPYYINKLCYLLWENKQSPSTEDVHNTWNKYVDENRSWVEQELSLLPLNQRKVLLNLALDNENKKPFGSNSSIQWEMSSSSIHRAMKALLEKDLVFINERKAYKILDPLLKSILCY